MKGRQKLTIRKGINNVGKEVTGSNRRQEGTGRNQGNREQKKEKVRNKEGITASNKRDKEWKYVT